MQIHSISKILIFPLVISAILIIYFGETSGDYDMTVWVIIPVIIFAIIIIFTPQIDYWYHKKYPIVLDKNIIDWVQKFNPFYNSLNEEDRQKFRKRLSLYIEAREFKAVGEEIREVPEDLKGMIGSIPIMMTFYKSDFLVGDYDRIYLYKHPFPSPVYQFLHSVEVNHEDGVFVFSIEHLLPGITRPEDMYNIGMHAFAEAYIKLHKLKEPDHISWKTIENISPYTKDTILRITGYEEVRVYAVLITCFFLFPDKLQAYDVGLFESIKSVFASP